MAPRGALSQAWVSAEAALPLDWQIVGLYLDERSGRSNRGGRTMPTGLLARLSLGAVVILAIGAIQAASPSSVRAGAGADCDLTVTPSIVEIGDDFWVAGNFNNAVVYQVKGKNRFPGGGDGPVAFASTDTPDFRFRFHAEPEEVGVWTIWAIQPATECSDSAIVTVVSNSPDTAIPQPRTPGLATVLGTLLALWGLAWMTGGCAKQALRRRGPVTG